MEVQGCRLFFANAQQVGDQIWALVAKHRPSVLALDMSRVPDIEYSALKMLMDGNARYWPLADIASYTAHDPKRPSNQNRPVIV